MSVLDLSAWQLALASLLVVVVIAVSVMQRLGLERDLVIGAVRTIVQLYLVGLILTAVFAAATWYWVVLILVVMTAVATHAAVSRLGRPLTSAALAGDRLQSDLRARRDEVEARLALGFSGREALQPLVRGALRAAMIPTVNVMMTVGVV